MRVALIAETFLPDVNGVAATICRILEHLQAEEHPALLFAPTGSPECYAGATVVPLRGVAFPLYPQVRLTPPQPGVLARLRAFRPDVLHVVGPIFLGSLAPRLGRQLGIPVVSTYHTHFSDYAGHYGFGFASGAMNAYLRWIHNRTSITLCPSTDSIAVLRERGFERLALWGRGVDTTRFSPDHRQSAWRRAHGIGSDECILLYVGRLANEKRLGLIAEALPSIDRAHLVLLGDGPARTDLERRFRGLPSTFVGFQRGHDLAEAYASADVFVFPSDTDTFGQVVQEAMASALPVVGARAGGTLDLVQDGATGLLFNPNDASDLASKLRCLASNGSVRRAMGQAGRRAAERRGWPAVVGELIRHYQNAIDARSAALDANRELIDSVRLTG